MMRIVLLVLLVSGCSGTKECACYLPFDMAIPRGDSSSADQAVASNDLAAYPTGPYGNTAGALFPPLAWEGYVDDAGDAIATTKPYGPYGADALRRSGRAYALVHLSAFY
jgi:hypothetical protein